MSILLVIVTATVKLAIDSSDIGKSRTIFKLYSIGCYSLWVDLLLKHPGLLQNKVTAVRFSCSAQSRLNVEKNFVGPA